MRARALHPDAILITSALLALNCLLIRGQVSAEEGEDGADVRLKVVEVRAGGEPAAGAAGETFLIDSPVLPEELEMLASVAAQARFPPLAGLLATHGDWDHLLGPLAFPQASLGCAESTAERLASEPGAAQRALRSFDEGLYLERPRPLSLGTPQALPVPGRLDIGERELELHPTEGHTGEGMAVSAPWAGVMAVGDYLSAIEIPMLSPGGSIDAYLATLARLEPLVARAEHIVPGHGPVLDAEAASTVLGEDVAYLAALRERGAAAELPPGRRGREQRAIHARNAAAAGDGGSVA